MCLITVKVFLQREELMSTGGLVDCRTKVVGFRADETTEYEIFFHRWIDLTEVDYGEMVGSVSKPILRLQFRVS